MKPTRGTIATIAIVALLTFLLAGCNGNQAPETPETVTPGSVVSIEYNGTFENGTRFDSSEGREPLTFQAGAGQIIPGLEEEILGMSLGESKTVEVPPAEAYGVYNESRVQEVPIEQLGAGEGNLTDFEGQVIQLTQATGQIVLATVVEVGEENVTLDFNHPLAGETLIFDVTVVGIE